MKKKERKPREKKKTKTKTCPRADRSSPEDTPANGYWEGTRREALPAELRRGPPLPEPPDPALGLLLPPPLLVLCCFFFATAVFLPPLPDLPRLRGGGSPSDDAAGGASCGPPRLPLENEAATCCEAATAADLLPRDTTGKSTSMLSCCPFGGNGSGGFLPQYAWHSCAPGSSSMAART